MPSLCGISEYFFALHCSAWYIKEVYIDLNILLKNIGKLYFGL